MRVLHAVRARLGLLFGRRSFEARMDDEFRFHVEMEAEKYERQGVPPAEARRLALVAFGAGEAHREVLREGRGVHVLADLVRDGRHALRSLLRSPAYLTAAVLTLALGIGLNAAVFSLLSALLFRPLPFPQPDRLVTLYQTERAPDRAERPVRWSYPEFEAVRGAAPALQEVAAYNVVDVNFTGSGEPVRVSMEHVTASYFRVLGVPPALGRAFASHDDGQAGAHPEAILGHALWRSEFGADPSVIGASVQVNGVPLTVVGVAPEWFRGLSGAVEIWVPQSMAPLVSFAQQHTIPQHFLSVVARLTDDVGLDGAQAQLSTLRVLDGSAARIERGAAGSEWDVRLARLDDARRHAGAVRARLALAGAVLFVLLIGMVNLAGLMLARTLARQRELSIRAALGAGQRRLLQQTLLESAIVGVLGGAAGIVIAGWCVRVLPLLAPERLGPHPELAQLASFAEPTLDWRVLLFAFTLAVGAALATGLAPALRGAASARRNAAAALKAGRGTSAAAGSLRRPTLLSSVMMVQVACALVLLVGAGALLHAFERLHTRDAGFDGDDVISFRLTPPDSRYAGDAAVPLLRRVLERVEAVPGVASATVSRCTPFMRCSSTYVHDPQRPSAEPPLVGRHYVGPDHFRTLGIPLLSGRVLTAADDAGAPPVAVISATAARLLWPGEDPLGKRVWFTSGAGFDSADALTEVVGVVGDVLYDQPVPGPEFYTSYLQFTWPSTMVMVKAAADPLSLVPALRAAVADIDPTLPIHDVATLPERRAAALAGERFAALALSVFATLAILLVAVGIYGITAYSVAQRRRELAIRVALGAHPGGVLRLVITNGLTLIGAGLAAGVLLSLWLTRSLATFVVDGSLAVPHVIMAAVPILLGVAFLASWLPARAVTRIEPLEALAQE